MPASIDAKINAHLPDGLGVSVMSCWEVAKLVELGRLQFSSPVDLWIANALNKPGITLIDFTIGIAIASTQLPGTFHRDPADQILVATAIQLNIPIVTVDERIRRYPHVQVIDS